MNNWDTPIIERPVSPERIAAAATAAQESWRRVCDAQQKADGLREERKIAHQNYIRAHVQLGELDGREQVERIDLSDRKRELELAAQQCRESRDSLHQRLQGLSDLIGKLSWECGQRKRELSELIEENERINRANAWARSQIRKMRVAGAAG